tara:strand:- start:49 stop:546 length:498 start_codon:yes stop_codon:yes gene_type:complete
MNELLEEFNNTLDEFVSKMINQFPEETKLTKYYQIFKLTKIYDKSLPIKIYMSSTLSNKEKIKNRDEKYFMYDSSSHFRNSAIELSTFSSETGLIDKWKNLSANSKTAIWDYIQTLFVMGEMYMNKNKNAIEQINLVNKNFNRKELNHIYESKKVSNSFAKILNN